MQRYSYKIYIMTGRRDNHLKCIQIALTCIGTIQTFTVDDIIFYI